MIDEILRHNREFVESKAYERYQTSKFPDKRIAIVTCMDTRLVELLPAALGIRNGDVKMNRDYYLQFEDLPAGEGYADIVYIPRHDSDWPALVIELKWNKTAKGAIDQILKKKYPSVLENLGCPILLVGITYDKEAGAGEKKHVCKIIDFR